MKINVQKLIKNKKRDFYQEKLKVSQKESLKIPLKDEKKFPLMKKRLTTPSRISSPS